ncbi:MAG: hypothetical protein EXS16_04805 [Gemmataceae bacterium]|nr:hypothetical protein [Gemmataceae bacterium]
MRVTGIFLLAFCLIPGVAFGDGPMDNLADNVRPVPPPGIKLAADDIAELTKGVAALGNEIDDLRKALAKEETLLEFLPDVQIFYNAVHYALKYNEFHAPGEVAVAKKLLKQGHDRAKSLRKSKLPWNTATGLIVRGYQSKIDGSVQPYGILVPDTYKAGAATKHRLDLWWHGRGEKLSELSFVEGRQKDKGQFTPAGAFVLHPYGRYCNANHFAGEIDTFEAIAHARKYYPIDFNRVVARGFSMGGAACWNYAVHYPGLWAAAAPGAGFSETPDFLRVFQNEIIKSNAWQKKLLHWYDCTDWAENLYNLPTIAYSGELDKQKQAADIMAVAMKKEGLDLVHIIGPKTGHSYHPEAKARINLLIDPIVEKGRDPLPLKVRFTTYTLRYNLMRWVRVDGLKEHWERARVEAEIVSNAEVKITTSNVTALTLGIPVGVCPLPPRILPTVTIDRQKLTGAAVGLDKSWLSRFRLVAGKWQAVVEDEPGLAKRHGLQGPIDDAFMDSFVMVKPTGTPLNEKAGKWITSEFAHAVDHWRRQFRGELKPINDIDLDPETIADSNLVLWGDPQSNKVLAQIIAKLPIRWDAKGVVVGDQTFAGENQLPVLIYPNPLNPKKYVVLNSGFTFREYDYLNNARQIPRLPDWAVLDINQPRTSQQAAGITAAGFFDESWQVPAGK